LKTGRLRPAFQRTIFSSLLLESLAASGRKMARVTGLEPATSGVTGRHSNQLSYTRASTWRLSAPSLEGELRGSPHSVKRMWGGFSTIFQLFFRSPISSQKPSPGAGCVDGANLGIFLQNKTNFACEKRGDRLKVRSERAISSVGRAPRLHRGCRRFESVIAHHSILRFLSDCLAPDHPETTFPLSFTSSCSLHLDFCLRL
jgi:hypothetical protein